jgi:glycosyltransferase involved in cell wall biosynthesis
MKLSGDKKINVLHVLSRLPVGGVENMLLKVVKGYDKSRFNVKICCLKEGGEIADELKRLGFKVEILNRMKGHGFDRGTVTALCKFIKKGNIHILRTHHYHANLYGRIAGIISRVPVIISSFHDVYKSPERPKFHRSIINFILSLFTDKLIAVSKEVASDIIKYDRVNPKKIKVIYNGIQREEFSEEFPRQKARDIFKLPQNLFAIGTVGRLTEQKGHRFLIKSVAGMADTFVAIAGDGPLKNELKDLSEQYNINCYLLGTMPPGTIPVFLRTLDIFCFPSLWEGFGGALIEAMAAGLPIVASDIPPHREVIGDAGILAAPENTDELSRVLKMLIDNPSLREEFGQKAKKRANIFSIEKTVKAYEDLFEEKLRAKGIL